MRVESKLISIKNNDNISTEYVESELQKLNINPLRWAVVDVNDKIFKISVADLKE